ncbi:MAG: hypothetical protein MUW56_06140 [Chryseobacterium sp.]|uniref:hypothetical protein n=1 Tax=Chryseobacterium sp. TaxID=1871047 RepID=UPI0025B8E951|nr:hypothetical protein [Chryseobacterium sp.]MCJ7933214.1 hypothetical protein [Chryseobacterium sp.]
MRKSKKLDRQHLKSIDGGVDSCHENCPPGPYGPGLPGSYEDYHALPECCKGRVMVSIKCFERFSFK